MFRRPKAVALVPSHEDGLAAQLRFGDEKPRLQILRCDQVLERFGRIEWLLHLLLRSAHCAPAGAGCVNRHIRRLVFKGFDIGPLGGHFRFVGGIRVAVGGRESEKTTRAQSVAAVLTIIAGFLSGG